MKQKTQLGYFGDMVKYYEKARRPYQPQVFRYLKSLLKAKSVLILDLGCGTGLSTRALSKVGNVIGCDFDPKMLEVGKRHKDLIPYIISPANKLPFPDAMFDVVTAFSAFHWFDDKKSVAEIKRVLKPGGLLFIGNHDAVKSWGNSYRQVIIDAIKQPVAHFKSKNYQPKEKLLANGFKKIRVKSWQEKQLYTIIGALDYVQSISIWNSVPLRLRSVALAGLKNYFIDLKKRTGKIERNLTATVTVGIK